MTILGRKMLATACAALFVLASVAPIAAQKRSKKQQEQPTTGNIVGRVKVAPGRRPRAWP